jgi:hypothetical protein
MRQQARVVKFSEGTATRTLTLEARRAARMWGLALRVLLWLDVAVWRATATRGRARCIDKMIGAAAQRAPPPARPRVAAASAVNAALAFGHLLATTLHAFEP